MPNLNNPETVTIEISPVLSNRQLNGLFRACHSDHEDERHAVGVDLEITRSRYLTTAIDRGPSQLGPTPDR